MREWTSRVRHTSSRNRTSNCGCAQLWTWLAFDGGAFSFRLCIESLRRSVHANHIAVNQNRQKTYFIDRVVHLGQHSKKRFPLRFFCVNKMLPVLLVLPVMDIFFYRLPVINCHYRIAFSNHEICNNHKYVIFKPTQKDHHSQLNSRSNNTP